MPPIKSSVSNDFLYGLWLLLALEPKFGVDIGASRGVPGPKEEGMLPPEGIVAGASYYYLSTNIYSYYQYLFCEFFMNDVEAIFK